MKTNKPASISSLILLLTLAACKSTEPEVLGLKDGKLQQCPDKPNCVLSQNADDEHAIKPLTFKGSVADAKAALRQITADYPEESGAVITDDDNYMHMEFTTSLMKYVDDVELLIQPDGVIQVRSASRVGHGDLGANRKRVEFFRAQLAR